MTAQTQTPPPPTAGFFSEDDRRVFGYEHPQLGPQFADPLRAYRTLVANSGGRLDEWLDFYERPTENPPMASQAADVLYGAAVAAFRLEPFDPATGKGTPEACALKLIDTFFAWCNEKKASGGSTSTSSPPSGSRPAAPSPTNSSSPCGCP